MINKIYTLSEDRNVTLTLYLHENYDEFQDGLKRPIVIVCPGGGYSFLSEREAEPVAAKYYAAGVHAAVLRYGINEHAVFPGPLNDIAGAVKFIRDHEEEWFIDEDAVIVSGFSAGGHVAASLGVFWNNKDLLKDYADDLEKVKPNGMILGYPVINLRDSVSDMDFGLTPDKKIEDIEFGQIHPNIEREWIFFRDKESGAYHVDFERAMNAYIFGGKYTDEQEDFCSLQNQVSDDTPSAFIWHASGDGLIYPSNSIDFARKLYEHNIPYELHIYQGGGHGVSLANYITGKDEYNLFEYCENWIDHAIEWMLTYTGYKNKILKYAGKKGF